MSYIARFNLLVGLLVLVFALCTICRAEETEMYSSKYDYVDAHSILENPRLRSQYLNCYLEKGPCVTPDAKFLKEKFPEAFVTRCSKCTERQKEFFDQVISWYTQNEPDTWNEVVKKTIEDIRKGN